MKEHTVSILAFDLPGVIIDEIVPDRIARSQNNPAFGIRIAGRKIRGGQCPVKARLHRKHIIFRVQVFKIDRLLAAVIRCHLAVGFFVEFPAGRFDASEVRVADLRFRAVCQQEAVPAELPVILGIIIIAAVIAPRFARIGRERARGLVINGRYFHGFRRRKIFRFVIVTERVPAHEHFGRHALGIARVQFALHGRKAVNGQIFIRPLVFRAYVTV